MKVYFWTSSKCYPSQPASSASSALPPPLSVLPEGGEVGPVTKRHDLVGLRWGKLETNMLRGNEFRGVEWSSL